jgi:hypothetical protein
MVLYVLRYIIASFTASRLYQHQQTGVLDRQGSQQRRPNLFGRRRRPATTFGELASTTIDRLWPPYARHCPTPTKSLLQNNAMLYYCVSSRLCRNCWAISHFARASAHQTARFDERVQEVAHAAIEVISCSRCDARGTADRVGECLHFLIHYSELPWTTHVYPSQC